MANNFRMVISRSNDGSHVKLQGNFDGSSAFELLNLLKKIDRRNHRIFIHTDGLKIVHPFGLKVFLNHLHWLVGQPINVSFTGAYAAQMVPERVKNPSDAGLFPRRKSSYH